eukprot:516573_1
MTYFCKLLWLLSITSIVIVFGGICDDVSCDVCLSNSDFTVGTYRILVSGKYCLSEDIIFNPLSTDYAAPNIPYNWFPKDDSLYPGCLSLDSGGYALGFFAAITVETDDVELDLKKYSISMDKEFYVQQRFFALIEIGATPFVTGQGPADFGDSISVDGVYIHDGELGLTSHYGIHANDVSNVVIENLRISQFEVGGVQMNGFDDVELKNVIVGPSVDDLPVCGTYSNAKYLTYAYLKMIESMGSSVADNKTVTFSGDRMLTVQEIYDNLLSVMDIAFRYAMDVSTDDDLDSALYETAIDLFANPSGIPDGASLYGLVFHSFGVAVEGFGQGANEEGNGENLVMENVKVQDLALNVNDLPAVYFDECEDEDSSSYTILKGPFGDVMDVRRMVGSWDNSQIIDLGDDFTDLTYIGNPLSDAQIALSLFGDDYGDTDYRSVKDTTFLQWALTEYDGESFDGLPSCTQFMCNGDDMFHTNKGIFGIRVDLIENVTFTNIIIKRLINKSPLASYACSNYTGYHDGGNPFQLEDEGFMGTDVKGIAVTGSDVVFDGYNNVIEKLISYNGDVVGLHLIDASDVLFDYVYKADVLNEPDEDTDTEDDRAYLHIKQLCPGHEITFALLAELMVDAKYPYPNNFYACNIKVESDDASITPYPPNGIDTVFCADYVPNNVDDIISNILPVDVVTYDEDNMVDQGIAADGSAAAQYIAPKGGDITNKKPININPKSPVINKPNDIDNEIPTNTNAPYVFFILGVLCIVTVVVAIVAFTLKCGSFIMNENDSKISKKKHNKKYEKANAVDSDDYSDETESEDDQQNVDEI